MENVDGLRESLDKDVHLFIVVVCILVLPESILSYTPFHSEKNKEGLRRHLTIDVSLSVKLSGSIITDLSLRSMFIGTKTTVYAGSQCT